MRWRPIHLFLLVFQAFFLNVVVPGHERGAVQLAGSPCAECGQPASRQTICPPIHSCCANRTEATPQSPQPAKQAPDSDKAGHCAVCSFAANLCVPPVFNLTPKALELLDVCDPPAPVRAPSTGVHFRQHSRAPPLMG